jgi:uncharacterized Zn-finger protein
MLREKEAECPICDADILFETDDKPGDLVMCSYCKVTFKIVQKMTKVILVEDFEE